MSGEIDEVIEISSDRSVTCDSPVLISSSPSMVSSPILPDSAAGRSGLGSQRFTLTPTKREPSPMSSSGESDVDDPDVPLKHCRKRLKFSESDDEDMHESCGDNIEHYDNDPQLPVFSTVTSGYSASELARVLMNKDIDGNKVCHIQPLGVIKNATFIVDIDDVLFSDLKADDLGTWKNNGTKSTYFSMSTNGSVAIANGKPSRSTESSYYVLTRRYFTHGTYQLFRRIVVDIRDSQGQRNKYALIQYLFDGPEVEIKIKPHGKSKSNQPYFRTSTSTRKRISELAVSSTPKAVITDLTKEKGGELEARGFAALPRDRRQVSYARQRSCSSSCDPLYSIMLECKLAQGSADTFVQDVKAAPFPMCVMCFDWQLNDMARFLTCNHNFGVLTIDTTYKLGEFYVTPMTYPHLMLQDVKTSKHPTMIGPILVHQKVDFAAFNYFASSLIGLRRDLKQVLAFGTDGDKALVEALSHNFPFATQLRCFIHFKKNIETKLRELGLPSHILQEFVADIFGKRMGNTHQNGLVDCQSLEEFDESLTGLKSLWDLREKPYAPSSGPRFFCYFVQYQADVVRYHMRKDLRESVGLGSPPSTFTTNASESINAAIKRKVDFKESDWPKFNENMKHFVESQREEAIRALSGRGMYRLCPEFCHYGVSSQVWVKMRTEQRRDVVTSFEKAKLPRSAPSQSSPSVSDATGRSTEVTLSVSAEDSGIMCIPLVTLSAMWEKASELLSKENGITAAPGSDPKARMVVSYSQDTPHHIRSRSDGQYLCDNHCPQWMSSQICSHTLAVAEHNGDLMNFLQWYIRSGQTPNISTLALSGLPRGRGQKGGKPKRQRSKVTSAAPDDFTLRPGLVSISSENAVQPIVQSSEHHQPVNVSTTISVVPESNTGAHVNISGVVQGSQNACTSQGDLQLQVGNQGYGQVSQEREHTPLSLSAVGYEQGMVTNPRRLQPPPLLNSQFLGQPSYSPEGYMYAVTRPSPVFYQKCDALSTYQGTKQPKSIQERPSSISSYGPTISALSGPPPLISTLPCQTVNPFYLKKLAGNIRVCQGCRGSLRSANGAIPSPPFDIVIARLERRQFRDASGTLKTPAKPSAAHYHFRLACIRACEPSFLPSGLVVPRDVAGLLYPLHKQHLQFEFGVQV